MMKYLLVALAAIMTFTSPAHADEGKPGKRVWMNGASTEQIVNAFLAGQNPCYGSKEMHTCYAYSPVSAELQLQQVSRPKGLNKNLVLNTVMQLVSDQTDPDKKLIVMRNEAGVPIARYQAGSEQQNAASLWTTGLSQMGASFVNGMGSTALCTIAGCNNGVGGGGGASAISISGSEANAFLQAAMGGGCPSGGCPAGVAPAPKTDK